MGPLPQKLATHRLPHIRQPGDTGIPLPCVSAAPCVKSLLGSDAFRRAGPRSAHGDHGQLVANPVEPGGRSGRHEVHRRADGWRSAHIDRAHACGDPGNLLAVEGTRGRSREGAPEGYRRAPANRAWATLVGHIGRQPARHAGCLLELQRQSASHASIHYHTRRRK